ncbi:MAG: hypothetical protein M1482_07350 [Chloroflexi bacterium]|nr:hypothetical protein [Chloroflexota bacterium]
MCVVDSIEIQALPDRVWYVLAHADEFQLQSGGTREEITSDQQQGVGTAFAKNPFSRRKRVAAHARAGDLARALTIE